MRLICHRGASGHAPENTLAAFCLALDMGASAMELDVRQTADKELVVIHDEDLRRVAGRGESIRDMTWQELRRFDVGSWFDARFCAERAPRFEEVFDLVGRKVELHVELKGGSRLYPGIEGRLVRLIRARRALKTCVVSSFEHSALYALRALEPRLRLGYLLGETPMDTAFRETGELKVESLHLSCRQASAARARAAHRRRLKLLVYTVNDVREARRISKMGADGVFSNFPELLERKS